MQNLFEQNLKEISQDDIRKDEQEMQIQQKIELMDNDDDELLINEDDG